MKTALITVGILLTLMGSIWFLQGINVLPGSFMTGRIEWAVYGTVAMAGGIGLLLIVRRRGREASPDD